MVAGIDSEAAQGDILNPVGSGKMDLCGKNRRGPLLPEKREVEMGDWGPDSTLLIN